ncbi:MAG: tRNA (adenosine(37)-N6)-threonylcarbamoyltransferase complex ATPase subunit type 1 TsaE [Lachnospiraceae bacterium]|nr:tRNA (adenosine(37)-N6)-threonylcarbamoyltransferase complex ATPase subunit type 1 TsaE [Lachnospiraceae bacterium]
MDKYSEVESESGNRIIKETFSEDESREFAKKMGEKALEGDVYTLIGDLGVGKTVFTQGFAAGLGIKEYINSPTFTIVQEYQGGRLPLYHFDVYRIGDISEMEEIGYEDYFYGDGVSLIEWADLIEELIPKDAVNIIIEKDLEKDFNYRRIIIESRKRENSSFN